ncbi:MAG: hypothetical protein EOP45_21130 [Sphingobacteriaceae bacterium]|nr:MAG: hypothetical protein EOP45_21130 [Sphingobacteriaceae bacterium]
MYKRYRARLIMLDGFVYAICTIGWVGSQVGNNGTVEYMTELMRQHSSQIYSVNKKRLSYMSSVYPKAVNGNPVTIVPYLHLVGNNSSSTSVTLNNNTIFGSSYWNAPTTYNTLSVFNASKTSVVIPTTAIYRVSFQTYCNNMPTPQRYSFYFQTTNTSGLYASTSGLFATNLQNYGWSYVNGSTTTNTGSGPFTVGCTYNGILIAGDEIWPVATIVPQPSTSSTTYGFTPDPAYTFFDIQQTARLQ